VKKLKRSDAWLLLSVIGLGLLVWAFLPAQTLRQTAVLASKPFDATPDLALPKALIEARNLVVEVPQSLRLGETGVIKLSIVPDPSGTPLQNIRVGKDYNAMIQARLEGDEGVLVPSGTQEEALPAGNKAIFTWQVTSQSDVELKATLWAYANLVPTAGGDEVRWPVLSLPLKIPVISLFGLPVSTVKTIGIACLVLGLALAGYSRLVLSSIPAEKSKLHK